MKEILVPIILLVVLGGFFGALIASLSKVLYVEVDTRVQDVLGMLPGINCGACGHPGCAGLAEAIVSGKGTPEQCRPGKQEMRDRIKTYLAQVSKELQEEKAK